MITDVSVHQNDAFALITAMLDFEDASADEPDLAPQRLTWVLVQSGDDWLILHEHNSVPLNNGATAPAKRAEAISAE